MRQYLRDRALSLVVFSFFGLAAMVAQPILALFNQVTSTGNTATAASAELSLADNNDTAFGGTVTGSFTAATGLQNNGTYKLVGYIDIKHTGATATTYGISNPTPDGLSGANADLNSNLKVVVHGSDAVPVGANNSDITYTCAGSVAGNGTGSIVLGESSNSIGGSAVAFSGLAEATSAHALPANGSGQRLCFYLGLPTSTPQTAGGGTATYAITFVHN